MGLRLGLRALGTGRVWRNVDLYLWVDKILDQGLGSSWVREGWRLGRIFPGEKGVVGGEGNTKLGLGLHSPAATVGEPFST